MVNSWNGHPDDFLNLINRVDSGWYSAEYRGNTGILISQCLFLGWNTALKGKYLPFYILINIQKKLYSQPEKLRLLSFSLGIYSS